MDSDPIKELVRSHREVELLKSALEIAERRKLRAHDRACELFEHNGWPAAVHCNRAIIRTDHDWQEGPRLEVIDLEVIPSSDGLVGLDCNKPDPQLISLASGTA